MKTMNVHSPHSSMKHLDRVHIIMPIHNVPYDSFKRAIQSVMRQSFRKWRLTIIESEESVALSSVRKEYAIDAATEDSRIVYKVQKRPGVSAARNEAIAEENTPLIAFLDGDDWWEPQYLEIMAGSAFANPNTDMFFCRAVYQNIVVSQITGANDVHILPFEEYEDIEYVHEDLMHYYFMTTPVYPSGLVVRREAMEQVGNFDETLNRVEDVDLLMKLTMPAIETGIARKILYLPYDLMFRDMSKEDTKVPAWNTPEEFQDILVSRYPLPWPHSKPEHISEIEWSCILDLTANLRS
jgi:glycosyltransferase involved in cell wall biosynthesis